MDYYIFVIIILSAMLIMSLVLNIVLIRKIERLQDADVIDDMTYCYEFENMSKEKQSKIIYL